MKIKKLTNSGIAHQLIPLAVVLLIAIIGTFSFVASHAATHTPAGSRARISKTAKQQLALGIKETPTNKVKYFGWAGDTPAGEGPWCAVFLSWVWHASGVRLNGKPYPLQPGVAQVRDTAKADGRLHLFDKASNSYTPKIGDAIIYGPSGDDHIGVVVTVSTNGRKIIVVEGNAARQPGGSSLFVVKRIINLNKPTNVPHGKIYGFVAPPGT